MAGGAVGRTPAGRGAFPLLDVRSRGRLGGAKGLDRVIEALAELPNAELVVAGGPADGFDDDPEVRRLRAVAARNGLCDRVSLIGPISRDQVPALLRSADVVACTPW